MDAGQGWHVASEDGEKVGVAGTDKGDGGFEVGEGRGVTAKGLRSGGGLGVAV